MARTPRVALLSHPSLPPSTPLYPPLRPSTSLYVPSYPPIAAVLNDLLACMCWGSVTHDPEPHWTPVTTTPTTTPCSGPLPMVTYKDYVEDILLPYPPLQLHAPSHATYLSNRERKAQRTALVSSFTQRGQPGHQYYPVWARLCQRY